MVISHGLAKATSRTMKMAPGATAPLTRGVGGGYMFLPGGPRARPVDSRWHGTVGIHKGHPTKVGAWYRTGCFHGIDQHEGTDDMSKGLVHSRLAIDPKERKVARSHQFSRYAKDETPQALLHIGTSVVNLSHDPLRSCSEYPYRGQLRRGVQAPGRGSESNCP